MTTTTQGNIFAPLDPENQNRVQNKKKAASKTPKATLAAEGKQNQEPLGEGGAYEVINPEGK
jgi:hypothetical protein